MTDSFARRNVTRMAALSMEVGRGAVAALSEEGEQRPAVLRSERARQNLTIHGVFAGLNADDPSIR